MSRVGDHGHGLLEVLVGLALAALLATWSAPALFDWSERRAVWEEATGLAMQVHAARAAAASDGRTRGLVFEVAPADAWTAVTDGDADGISTADLQSGVDGAWAPRHELQRASSVLGWGLPDHVPPAPGGVRPATALPFSPTGILSLAPDGTSSTGTVYLCGTAACAAVRMYGPAGRISVWDWRDESWRQRW